MRAAPAGGALAGGVLVGGVLVAVLLGGCSAPGPSPTPSAGPAVPSVPAAVEGLRIEPAVAKRPTFTWSVRAATAKDLGSSWRKGCPVGPASLRVVRFPYWTWDGKVASGVLILHSDVVARAEPVFALMYAGKWPLRSVRPVTSFGSSDDRSMAADNTSAFNCRKAVTTGPSSWSRHAYGRAIDVNPRENPYLLAGKILPAEGRPFVERAKKRKGLIRRGDAVHSAFLRAGFGWGGDFRNPDYQHFER